MASVMLKQDKGEFKEESRLAISILLQEIQAMRHGACQLRRNYQEDKVALIVAAMTTDMAIRLPVVQKTEVEFDLVFQRPNKYPLEIHPVWKLLDILGELTDGIAEPDDSSKKNPSDSFWHTYRGLKYYFDRIMNWDPKKSLPAMVPKDFGDR
ncbi:hypothetical protein BDU57DRAFT_528111 [Ampelomyces quisqualis]|uniref:DUF6604 domain-containing protein n=1 Tax=Ampelomyces quisqualis TaxID=50730 RepID=A0A6A5QS90_AMPQU|nr:hypothetical protein BDU57DRAFT_528111 [Ampelomyces quisqualis]